MNSLIKLLQLLFIGLLTLISYGQVPPPVLNVILSNQQEVNETQTNWPGGEFTSVEISGNDIIDLSPLAYITSIGELRIIDNPLLENLTGLSNIVSISNIKIESNDLLENLNGLPEVTLLNDLEIIDNDSLLNLDVFNSLITIDNLFIQGNETLPNLNGFSTLETVNDVFSVGDNSALLNFTGLSSLETITSSFLVSNNASLQNFSGLSSLTGAFDFSIMGNSSLINFTGLSSLDTLRTLQIDSNDGLQNFNGFTSLTVIHVLRIWNNLLITSLEGLESVLDIGNDALFTAMSLSINNNTNLVSLQGVENAIINGGGDINFSSNPQLQSLSGLNLDNNSSDFESFLALYIYNNENLQTLNFNGDLGYSFAEIFIGNNPSLTSLATVQDLNINTGNTAGQIIIENNDMLVDLQGLNNVQYVDDFVIDDNDSLLSLDGLDNFLSGSPLYIENNDSLESISFPNTVTFSGLILNNNAVLNDIDNLVFADGQFENVEGLIFTDNPNLAVCNTTSVCAKIPSLQVFEVFGNAEGCVSANEVSLACNNLSTNSLDDRMISIFPNPVSNSFYVDSLNVGIIKSIELFSILGKKVLETNELTANVSSLESGIYFLEIITTQGRLTKRIIKN